MNLPNAQPLPDRPAHSPEHDCEVLATSDLFDAAWYVRENPDVAASGLDPLVHFVLHGAAERRNPSDFFSTGFYIDMYPDVAHSPFNPLVHYVLHGRDEGRRPHPEESLKGSNFPLFANESLNCHGFLAVSEALIRDATSAELLARPNATEFSPLISLILPVFNTPPRFLREVLQAVRAQTYERWEVCISDDCSSAPATLAILEEIRSDPRIRVSRLEQNGGIAKASHAALLVARGEYVAFLDHDDLLTQNALSEVVSKLRQDPSIDYIYSDHVQADQDGKPFSLSRKPAWSPEFLLSTNYIVHFKVVRRELLLRLGGIAGERSQAQDLAMSLRLARGGARVAHIPQGLYLWREHKGSVAASAAAKPGIESLLVETYQDHLRELGSSAQVFWPRRWRESRVGAFELTFPDEPWSTALVVIARRGAKIDRIALERRHAAVLAQGVSMYVISAGSSAGDALSLANDAEVRRFFGSLSEDKIVLVGSGRIVTPAGLAGLTGYLSLSPEIGAVGAKILDPQLRVVSGGHLLTNRGEYGLICGGEFDNSAGHWLTGQIASNVDAVSSRGMAVQRATLVDGPGLKLHRWGDLSGVALSRDLRRTGARVVYNPGVKIVDAESVQLSRPARSQLHNESLQDISNRIYKEF